MANLGTFLAGGATPHGSKLPGLAVIGGHHSFMEECVGAGQGANPQGSLQGDVGITAACAGEMLGIHPCSSAIAAETLQSPGSSPLCDQVLLQTRRGMKPPGAFTSSKISTCRCLKVQVRARKGIVSPLNLVSRANTKGRDWRGFVPLGPCEKPNVGAAWLFCTSEQTPMCPPSPHL